MKKTFSFAHLTDAKKDAAERRYRNIAANSGEIMESNEIRDIENFYVMCRDAKLRRISDLAKDPDQQTEEYSLNLVMNHGHTDAVTGERIVGVEDIIGDARVWLEDDGLHARVYFANNDPDADHCWAISDNASYSIGADHYPDGYEGAGNVIDEPIAILREISMVDTGNDPRAVTIDTISGKGSTGAAAGDNKLSKKGNSMGKTIDQLTPDERRALGEKLLADLDDFTTNAPESETEPTARDNKDDDTKATTDTVETEEDGATEPTETRKSNDRVAHQIVRVVRDRGVHQERGIAPTMKLADFKKSEKFNDIVRKSLRENDMSLRGLDAVLAKNFKGIMTRDDIVGLPALAPTEQLFMSAFAGADGILSHIRSINTKAFRAHAMTLGAGEAGRAHGHRAGDEKTDQTLNDAYRDILTKTIYKRNPIDEEMLYENPQLLNYTDEEIDELIRAEIERAIVIGDGRTEPASGSSAADYRVFDGTRGIWSIKADAAAEEGYGSLVASTITLAAGDNLYAAMVKARGAIKARGRLIVVTKSSAITDLLTTTTSNGYLVQPGTSLEQFLQVAAVYTPEWMDADSNLAYVFAENQFGLIGETSIVHRNTFDTKFDTEVRMGEIHRGGSLLAAKAAVAIAPAASAPAQPASNKS